MEFDLWAQLPSVLPEVGLTALAIIVLFADIYGSVTTRRNVVFISAVGMALLALVPLIWLPDPALFENGTLLWGGMVNYDPLSQIFKVMLLARRRSHLPDVGRRQRCRRQRRILSDCHHRHTWRRDDVERERFDSGFRGARDLVDPALYVGEFPSG